MNEIESFRGLSNSEQIERLEQVISRSKKLMFLSLDDCLLMSNDEQEKLWKALDPYLFFDPQREIFSANHHIYILGKAEFEAILIPCHAPDCYSIIDGHHVAVQLLAGGKSPHFEIMANDGIPRTVWLMERTSDIDGQIVIGFYQMVLAERLDLLAVSEFLPCEQSTNYCGVNTPEHKVMVAVHNEYWADGQGATQEEIRAWILDKFKDLDIGNGRTLGKSKTKIEYIERFCRPPNRREGRRGKQ